MQPNSETLSNTISTTRANGQTLLDDAKLLLEWDRFSTAFALAILAQEEFAKAFLLELVDHDDVPGHPAYSVRWRDTSANISSQS